MGTTINTAYGPGAPLELCETFTPLGIRFWDLTLNLPVDDGLAVNLRLANSNAPAVTAVRTRSGVYAFFGLPGLWAAEHPGPAGYGPTRTFRYIVTVQDLLGRYLPSVLVYTLDQSGALLVNGSPNPTPGARLAHLFSAASRPVPPGVGAVRADLVDHDTGEPAAWAVIQLQIAGQPETWTGIADDAGRLLVLVPYPVVQALQSGSPPGSGQGSVSAQTWPVTIEALYSPDQLSYPAASFKSTQWPWTDTPSLKDIFVNQQAAAIWSDATTSVAHLAATLQLGVDLVLSTAGGSPPASGSALGISRGSSPP